MTDRQNRREYVRKRRQGVLTYSCVGSEEYHDARLVDVGQGGLCMESCMPLKTGTALYIQVVPQHPETDLQDMCRSFHGKVRWTRDLGDRELTRYGIGVQYSRPVPHI